MPRPSASAPPDRHTAGPLRTREQLRSLRPDLLERYDAALPAARAAILGRLLGAVGREALPGLVSRGTGEAAFTRTAGGDRSARGDGRAGAGGRWAEAGGHERGATEPGRAGDAPGGIVLRFEAGATAPFFPGVAGLAVAARFGGAQRSIVDPGELVRLLWGEVPLAGEIDNSVANLALARAVATGRPWLPEPGPDALGVVEQQVVDGHPLHPCCRTRGGMSVADVLAYAPEHSPVIRLRRLRVPAGQWFGDGPPVLYAHPWQAQRLLQRYPWLHDDGPTAPVRPLMSLRTVAPLDGGPHVKTAVDVQMTSAVRTVSPAAVHNGPLLSRLLERLTADLPIDVLAETGAGAVIVDGEPQRHLAHLFRRAPRLADGEVAVPLAWPGAVPMWSGRGDDPYEIMGLIATLLVGPAVRLLARGVALEAHGQNTLLVLRGGRPVRVLYRDLGGVRVSPARLRAAGVDAPPLLGDLPSDDPAVLRTKLAAAVLGTVAQQLIADFGRHGADERRLWAIVAAAIRDTGTADAPHLLRDPLPVKATTAMRLAADPLDDLWASLDNPMAAHG
ncbi:IucA/IucC family protein [Paractinoplanes deccanensis]|uniref:IucA/IucC family protein n=1 Tax=Paractinoplanes deccanensis TaxID=113561 RepID=UPI001EF18105|nr:IucA/IucC family protein [Actinoplanes deccanensis]